MSRWHARVPSRTGNGGNAALRILDNAYTCIPIKWGHKNNSKKKIDIVINSCVDIYLYIFCIQPSCIESSRELIE